MAKTQKLCVRLRMRATVCIPPLDRSFPKLPSKSSPSTSSFALSTWPYSYVDVAVAHGALGAETLVPADAAGVQMLSESGPQR